jgi:putative spermidine/putrescine transport system permease protein
MTRSRLVLATFVTAICIFIVAPILSITLGALTQTSYVVFPPQGFTLKWYLNALGQRRAMDALGFSLGLAAASATTATLIAFLIANAGRQRDSRFYRFLKRLALAPAMLPAVFLGLALLVTYSRLHLRGMPALFVGHVVSAMPFAISMVTVGLNGLNPQLESAARSLGAKPLQVLLKITLPLTAWSLLSSWGFAFMISFGALEVSLFLSSSTSVTLPVYIYSSLEWMPMDPTLTAIASGVILLTLTVLVISARLARLDRFLKR